MRRVALQVVADGSEVLEETVTWGLSRFDLAELRASVLRLVLSAAFDGGTTASDRLTKAVDQWPGSYQWQASGVRDSDSQASPPADKGGDETFTVAAPDYLVDVATQLNHASLSAGSQASLSDTVSLSAPDAGADPWATGA